MLILFSLIGGWDQQQHQQSGGWGTASQDANSAWNQQNSGAAAQPDQQQQQYDWSQGTVTVSSLCLLVLVHVIDLSTVHCDHV